MTLEEAVGIVRPQNELILARAENERLSKLNAELLEALGTALMACRAYRGAADARTWASAAQWHCEAQATFDRTAAKAEGRS